MDKVFKNLEKAGKNDVDSLIKWMKDSKIVDPNKTNEELRKLFHVVDGKQKVDFEKFKQVVTKVASKEKKTVDQLSQQLAAEALGCCIRKLGIMDAGRKGYNYIKGALKIDK